MIFGCKDSILVLIVSVLGHFLSFAFHVSFISVLILGQTMQCPQRLLLNCQKTKTTHTIDKNGKVQVTVWNCVVTSRTCYISRHEKNCIMHTLTTKPQTRLRIVAIWSAPLMFADYILPGAVARSVACPLRTLRSRDRSSRPADFFVENNFPLPLI